MSWKWTGFSWDPNVWKSGIDELFGFGDISHAPKEIRSVIEHDDDPAFWYDRLDWDPFAQKHIDKKTREDKQRWYDDLEKNTGQSPENSQYPWLQQDYWNSGRSNSFAGDMFAVSEAIMSLYSKGSRFKW